MAVSLAAIALALGLGAGCDKDKGSTNDPDSNNLLGINGNSNASSDDDFSDGDDDMFGDDEGDEIEGEEVEAAPKKKLPKRAKAVKKCKTVGKGKEKKKECKLVDPKPKVSASHGVVALLGDFRWGLSPRQVFTLLSRDIENEYTARQKKSANATDQDANRRWRSEELAQLKRNNIKFTTGSKHRWGVSLIQYEYADDNDEEMLYIASGNGLRKFYFFKNGELWKVFYAYSTDVWPGKTYDQIVEEKFKKWFGPSPEQKTKINPKTEQPIISYLEWKAMDGEIVRSFDMTSVHGVMVLAVIDGNAESSIGERLPNMGKEAGYSDVVSDVLGGTDVCYDANGDISQCSEEKASGLE